MIKNNSMKITKAGEFDYGDLYEEDAPSRHKKKKSNDIDSDSIFHEVDYGISIPDSIIYLHGDIAIGNLFDFISKSRIILDNRPKEKSKDPLTLLINSNGGDVYEALGIIDYMETLPVKVNVIARGRAMSAGAMILMSGTGVRACSRRTTIMVHEASAEIFGKSADIKANADHIDEMEEDFYKEMEIRTKQTADFWRKACRKDFYMSAEKALEYGLIDKII